MIPVADLKSPTHLPCLSLLRSLHLSAWDHGLRAEAHHHQPKHAMSLSDTQTKTNTKFFPPITAYMQLQNDTITQITWPLKHDYLLEYIPNGLKIRISHIDDFDTIKTYLATNGHEHFDYGYESPKFARFVVRGLPVNIESNELIAGFAAKEIILQQHRQLKKTIYDEETNSRKTIKLPLWVIAIEKKKDTIYKLRSIVGIHHIKIKIEDYRGRSEIQQCYKCQKFGHKAYFCNMKKNAYNVQENTTQESACWHNKNLPNVLIVMATIQQISRTVQ